MRTLKMLKSTQGGVVLLVVMAVVLFTFAGHIGGRASEVSSPGGFLRMPAKNRASIVEGNSILESDVANMLLKASEHPRKRKMFDLTSGDPASNSMQVLVNAWEEGSFSPVHMHRDYDEVFVAISGELAFFTFSPPQGGATKPTATCHIISTSGTRLLVVPRGEHHAMTAAPRSMGYSGRALVMEASGHTFNPRIQTKFLHPAFGASLDGQDGLREDFKQLLLSCPSALSA